MAHFNDMGDSCQFRLFGGPIRAIGWLSRSCPYPRETMVSSLRDVVLNQLRQGLYCGFHCGVHVCEFCYQKDNPGKVIDLGSEMFIRGYPTGNGVIIVPGERYLFVAPTMLGHYIEHHDYRPPAEFITALLDCPDCNSDLFIDKLRSLLGNHPDGTEFVDELVENRRREHEHWARLAVLSEKIEASNDPDALAERAALNSAGGTASFDDCLADISRAISIVAKPKWFYQRARLYSFSAQSHLQIADLNVVIAKAEEALAHANALSAESSVSAEPDSAQLESADEWLATDPKRILQRALRDRALAYRFLAAGDESQARALFESEAS